MGVWGLGAEGLGVRASRVSTVTAENYPMSLKAGLSLHGRAYNRRSKRSRAIPVPHTGSAQRHQQKPSLSPH